MKWSRRFVGILPGLGGLGMLGGKELRKVLKEAGCTVTGLGVGKEPDGTEVAEQAKSNGTVTQPEVAAYLRVDVKTVRRMTAAGELRRCPGFGRGVRYLARDVLKLASAPGKEA